jgi:hypothetical protein
MVGISYISYRQNLVNESTRFILRALRLLKKERLCVNKIIEKQFLEE